MHVFDGATGELLTIVLESAAFDPWAPLAGDINGDGFVEQTDLDVVLANVGNDGPGLTVADGDRTAMGLLMRLMCWL